MNQGTALAQTEIQALIEATYSDSRPNPYEPQDEVEKRLNRFCWGPFSAAEEVYLVYDLPTPEYDWDQGLAHWIEDHVAETRLSELEEGAEPTDQEMVWYRRAAEEHCDDGSHINVVVRIYRLSACAASEEQRAVFFGWSGLEQGQNSSTKECVGPLRDMSEVSIFTHRWITKECESEVLTDFPEYALHINELFSTPTDGDPT